METLRDKSDIYNGIVGGLAAGCVLGIRYASPSVAVTSGAMMAIGVSAMDTFISPSASSAKGNEPAN